VRVARRRSIFLMGLRRRLLGGIAEGLFRALSLPGVSRPVERLPAIAPGPRSVGGFTLVWCVVR
jgi:hypothetical protein